MRASRLKDIGPLNATHSSQEGLFWIPWIGWYEAIFDLLPNCKKTYLTKKQILALKDFISPKLLDPKGNDYGTKFTIKESTAPAFCITANSDRHTYRAIIERVGYGQRGPLIRFFNKPSWTIRAGAGDDGKGGSRSPITSSESGDDIRALDYRCLARLQSFPDSFLWHGSKSKIMRGIGNAVPPLLAQRIIESFQIVNSSPSSRQSIQLETGEIVCGHWVDRPETNQAIASIAKVAIAHLETFGGQPHIDGSKLISLPTKLLGEQPEPIGFLLPPPSIEESKAQAPKPWIEESWKTINGKRYGPYLIKRWRDERGKKRSQYLGKATQSRTSPEQVPNKSRTCTKSTQKP